MFLQRIRRTRLLLILLATVMLIVLAPIPSVAADRSLSSGLITITVKASPWSTYPSVLTIRKPKLYNAIARAKPQTVEEWDSLGLLEDTEITVTTDSGDAQRYAITSAGDLGDVSGKRLLALPDRMRENLLGYVQRLRAEHYGEPLAWKDVDRLFPRKSKFTVTDLETGLHFRAQRRAGSNHADVQPLTKQDTAIMKQIYEGKWSWNRKAVIVEEDGRRIAASMHGMPHGGDGIPGNNFSGHFCIHFLGSETHGSSSVDLAHQTFVHKAAGRLPEFMRTLTPQQTVELFVIAVNQKDVGLLNRTLSPSMTEQPLWLKPLDPQITMLRTSGDIAPVSPEGQEETVIPLKATLHRANHKEERQQLLFKLHKKTPDGPWVIVSLSAKG